MISFIALGLAGGFLFAGATSLFFDFQYNHLEKYSTGVWALAGFVCVVIIVGVAFPLSNYCAISILKDGSKETLAHLRLVWAAPLLMSEYYWVDKIAKKQKGSK